MIIKKNRTVSEAIKIIIDVVDSTNLSFDKKRCLMIQSIKKYYTNEGLSTAQIIERKNTIESSSAVMNLFLIPFFVGASSSLLVQGYLESFKLVSLNDSVIELVFNCILTVFFCGLVCMLWYFIKNLICIRKRYARYSLFEHELEIIDMVLEARNLLASKSTEKLRINFFE